MAEYPDGFVDLVVALNRSMVGEEPLDETLRRVAFLACQSPIGADNAGVTLRRSGAPATAAYFGETALELDRVQYAADSGPCLEAHRTGQQVRIERMDQSGGRWPEFVAAALRDGITSSLSLPLIVKDETVGALNLYASRPMTFTEPSVHLATLFAEQAAVAVMNADLYWQTYNLTQNLQAALENRELIGQAKGILATLNHSTLDEAFDELRRTSQNLNIKLRDVAEHVVTTGELPRRVPG